VLTSSYDSGKFCTLPDRVLWYDESRTTSLHQQGDEMISSPSDLRIATDNSRSLHDPRGLHDLRDQLCLPPDHPTFSSRAPCQRLKKPSLGLGSLYAYVSNCKQIDHRFGLLQDDLLNILDVTHPVVKSIDNLDVLDVWDSVPSITEMFHVVLKAFIMLLLDGF
jgi:hypothetical protein